MNIVTGNHKPHHIAPMILGKDNYRYHPVDELKPSSSDDVVMWTSGSTSLDGHDADVHDGLRSGASSASTDMRFNHICYALLADWLADGNPQPK